MVGKMAKKHLDKGWRRIKGVMMKCIECGTDIVFPEDVMENELIDCDACGIELEVISIDPLKLDLAPEEQEDWGE